MSERKEVYVLGHRNPDTDSICSAIAYADVKNKENDGNHYVAARAGQISSETSYVLQRFGMRQPTYVNNIGTRVRDMEIRKIPGINEGISMKKAWSMMAEMNAVTLPIVDANNVLEEGSTVVYFPCICRRSASYDSLAMASGTTILGMLPLLFDESLQNSASFQSQTSL